MFKEERYDIIKNYSKEEIEAFYDAYVYNIGLNILPSLYLHPDDMVVRIAKEREWEIIAKKDGFLTEYKDDRVSLAAHILKHGNYFPIWCFIEDEKHIVSEGIHRVDSMHMARRQNIWKDEKCFTITMRKEFDVLERNYQIHNLAEPIEIYVPIFNIENGWYQERFGWKYKRFNNQDAINKAETDGNAMIIIDTEEEYYNACKIYHKLLRHCFYKFKTCNDDMILPRFGLR